MSWQAMQDMKAAIPNAERDESSGIYIGVPGHPIRHKRYGFDVLRPRRTPSLLHMPAWLGSPAIEDHAPRRDETWVQVPPARDWECILPGWSESVDATTRRIDAGGEVIRQAWRRQR